MSGYSSLFYPHWRQFIAEFIVLFPCKHLLATVPTSYNLERPRLFSGIDRTVRSESHEKRKKTARAQPIKYSASKSFVTSKKTSSSTSNCDKFQCVHFVEFIDFDTNHSSSCPKVFRARTNASLWWSCSFCCYEICRSEKQSS